MDESKWKDDTYTRKHQSNKQLIQPWFDQPGTLPYSLFINDTQKLSAVKNIKKCSSLQIPSIPVRSSGRSFQKRQQQFLPKMDIGIHTIKRGSKNPQRLLSPIYNKTLKRRKFSQTLLRSVSVGRELAIERKIYLINNKLQQAYKTLKEKQSRIRNIIKVQQEKNIQKSQSKYIKLI